MPWRSWCPEGAGDAHLRRDTAIDEVVAFLEADMFEPEDVRVEWWMDGRWVLALRPTVIARTRGREARRRKQMREGSILWFPHAP